MSDRAIELPAWDSLPVPSNDDQSLSTGLRTAVPFVTAGVVCNVALLLLFDVTWGFLIQAAIGFIGIVLATHQVNRLPEPERLTIAAVVYDEVTVEVSAADARGKTYAARRFRVEDELEAFEYRSELQLAIEERKTRAPFAGA